MTAVKPKGATEEQIQRQIVEGLRAVGLTVLHTSAFRQRGPSGVARGVPDLLVTRNDWPAATWVGLEVKRPGGKWSCPEQMELWERGRIARVTNFPEAVYAIFKAFPDPRLGNVLHQFAGTEVDEVFA